MITRKDLEGMATQDLTHLRYLIDLVLKDRAAAGGGFLVKLSTAPGVSSHIRLIRAVREALGIGLREANDLVTSRAEVQVPDEDARDRLLDAGADPTGVRKLGGGT